MRENRNCAAPGRRSGKKGILGSGGQEEERMRVENKGKSAAHRVRLPLVACTRACICVHVHALRGT